MSVLTKEQYMEQLKALIGDNTSDEAVHSLEDFTDTFNSLSNANSGAENWEQKYKDNDELWRKKYKERFYATSEEDKHEEEDKGNGTKSTITINDLFKER